MAYPGKKYKELPEHRKRYLRGYDRTRKHGDNWRQLVIDCDGLCVLCKKRLVEHFHEVFGEDHNRDGKMQQRWPVCAKCHEDEHNNGSETCPPISNCHANCKPSMVITDILSEMRHCGSFLRWCAKYKVNPVAGTFSRIVWPDAEGNAQKEMAL